MAPILFLIYMQAAIEVINAETDHHKLVFLTRDDQVFSGRPLRTRKNVVSFEVSCSLFADDGAFLYQSREDLQKGMDLIFKTFRRFGLTCHVGREGAKSKSEAMYFPSPRSAYQEANTSPLDVDGGLVSFTQEFKYLGSIVTSNLDDTAEVEARVKSAAAAFASLRPQFFGSKLVRPPLKRNAYEGLVLGLLLYGSEAWSLTQNLLRRLQMFHNRCVRVMCRVTLWHMRQYHISQEELELRLGLKPLDVCLAQRRLAWAGQVFRMDFDRLPRRLLTSWVDHPRPRGRPQFNYGHGLSRDLKNAGIDVATWHQAAADRGAWFRLTQRPDICKLRKPSASVNPPELLLKSPQHPRPPASAPQPSKSPQASSSMTSTSPPALPRPTTPLSSQNSPSSFSTVLHVSSPPSAILPIPLSTPLSSHSPTLRCSRRLADKARLAGGRRVYSLKPLIHS